VHLVGFICEILQGCAVNKTLKNQHKGLNRAMYKVQIFWGKSTV